MEVIAMSNINSSIKHAENLFEDYPDIVKVEQLKTMLPKMGKNKIYKLLQENKIYSKKIGRDYYVPKTSVIKYLMEK